MSVIFHYIEAKNLSDFNSDLLIQTDILIQSLVPQVVLVRKYNLPFYEYLKWMCFLQVRKEKLELGFVYGNELNHAHGLFTNLHLKQVRHVEIQNFDILQDERLANIIVEASMLNEIKQKLLKHKK